MKQTRAIELGTGIFVLLGFAALFFLVTQITSREFGLGEGGYRLTASFDQVGGLKPGAPVSMSGQRCAGRRRVSRCIFGGLPNSTSIGRSIAWSGDSGGRETASTVAP